MMANTANGRTSMAGPSRSSSTFARWSEQHGSIEIVLGGLRSLALHEFDSKVLVPTG